MALEQNLLVGHALKMWKIGKALSLEAERWLRKPPAILLRV